jgi:hypothetical protein
VLLLQAIIFYLFEDGAKDERNFAGVAKYIKMISFDKEHKDYKPKGAQRYIRVKSLGEEYTDFNLGARIGASHDYEKNCDRRLASAKGMEREMLYTLKNVVVLFYRQGKPVRKIDKSKPFAIRNDQDIQALRDCLDVINREGIMSASDITRLVAESERKTAEAHERLKTIREQQETIKDIRQKYNLVYATPAGSVEKMKISAAKATLDFFEVSSRLELEQYEAKLASITAEAGLLEKEISDSSEKLAMLNKLSDIHEQGGDYVERLARQEQLKNNGQHIQMSPV